MPKKVIKKAGSTVTVEAIGNEFRRSVGVVTEHLEHKVDLVLEQYGHVVKGLEVVAREVAIVKQQTEIISAG